MRAVRRKDPLGKEAQRAARQKEVEKEAAQARFREEMQLLRPLRAFAVKENTSHLDTLGLFRTPQVPGLANDVSSDSDAADERGRSGGSSKSKGKAALLMLLGETEVLPAVFEFVGCGDLFKHRLWCRGMRRLISRMPLNLRVSPLESLAMCVFLREASVDDGTTVVDVEMGGGERRDSTASIPDLE